MNWLQYCLGISLLMLLPALSQAQRIALVFGNGQYAKLDNLEKAVNDATSMLRELKAAGFKVVNENEYKDLTRQEMLDARDSLLNSLSAGDQVVVFYSGHGVQIGSEVFLVPVGFPASVRTANRIAEEGLALQTVMDEVRERIGGDGFALYIIDACRNNPLPKTGRKSISNMLSIGLAPIPPPSGQIAVYAASSGQTALDRLGIRDPDPNGVFTRVLLKHLKKPGRPVMDILADVQEEVVELVKKVRDPETGRPHEQQPAVYNESRLKNPFCFRTQSGDCGQGSVAEDSADNPASDEATELEFWRYVDRADVGQVQTYLDTYPRGKFATLAQRIIARSGREQPSVTKVESPQPKPKPKVTVMDAPAVPKLESFEPETVAIPAGSFDMGSPDNETGRRDDEGPVHRVHVDAFRMGKYEVTNAQFRKFRPEHNSGEFDGHSLNGDKQPVVMVSWEDAVAYTEWLSKETGSRYRLPTEAEWEYAARAGTTTVRFWGNNPDQACSYANAADETAKSEWSGWTIHNCADGHKVTAPVGSYSPNPWELYDMLGNVWEWNQDKWHGNYDGAPTDGSAWESGDSSSRLLRGCSWSFTPVLCRTAYRGYAANPNGLGFRVVSGVVGRAD